MHKHFYSHAFCGAQLMEQELLQASRKISTHTPLTGCNYAPNANIDALDISTLIPLAGCDESIDTMVKLNEDFYSHAPEGRDCCV